MMRKSLGVLAATGLLATAVAAPAAAQDRVITIPEGEDLKVGAMFVLSGANAVLGDDMVYGIEAAVEDRGGELLGHEIKLVIEDSLCTAEGGALAAQVLTSDPDIVGIIGPACSGATDGAAQIISEAGLTHISGSATAPELTDPDRDARFDGFLRTAFTDAIQGQVIANYLANELGLTKIATIHDGSIYAAGLTNVVGEEFAKLGGEVTLATAVTDGQTDMGPVLTNVAQSEPELIYLPVFTDEGGFLVDQAADIPGLEDVLFFGSDGLFSLEFVEAAGDNVEGMYLSSPNYDLFADGYADMLETYLDISNLDSPLQAYHAQVYDAINILFTAIEQVAVDNGDGSHSIDLAELRSAIYGTTDFEGVTGTLSCGESGDCGAEVIAIYQVGMDTIDDEVWPPTVVYPTE